MTTANERIGRLVAASAVAALATGAGVAPAAAADIDREQIVVTDQTQYPSITGTVLIEVQNDYAFESDDPGAEINDLFNTTEAGLALNFNENISVQTLTILEPVRDPTPFDDRFFEDHGGFFEELYLQFEQDGIRLFGGKFDAAFGRAWDAAPGIYGVDFAEDYELVERLGGGGGFTFSHYGVHTLTGAVFFADTTVLSESVITNRGRTRRSSGGASNTESPESFSLALDSREIPGLPETALHVAFRHQAEGRGDFADENGVAVAIERAFALDEGRTLETIVEGVYLDNAFASPDNVYYLTAGAALIDGPWNVALSYTLRHTDLRAGGDFSDHLFQASGGYTFANGIAVNAGYRFSEEAGIDTHIVGVLLAKEFDVSNLLGR